MRTWIEFPGHVGGSQHQYSTVSASHTIHLNIAYNNKYITQWIKNCN